jgi:L-asparaginase II
MSTNPVLVEVTRGDMVESRHRGAAAVLSADGTLKYGWGDIEKPVYARSSIKPLQALPLIESGAADRFGLVDEDVALACASHSGEAMHVQRVAGWLARIGLGPADLECGPQLPMNEQAAAELLRSGSTPSALHNNCSGKHTGFLTTAVHYGEPTGGYIRADHPVQQRLRRVLEQMSGVDLSTAPSGIDGCGIPVIGISLRATATAMARMADPRGLPAGRVAAIERVLRAMMAAPLMVSGSGRFCAVVMDRLGQRVALKGGAEGFFTAAIPGGGLGVAVKIDDGAARAAAVAVGAILCRLGVVSEAERIALVDQLEPPVHNRAGIVVGRVRAAAGWLDG